MYSRLVKSVVIAALCAPIIGYAADAQLKAAAKAFSDSAILSEVKTVYAKDSALSAANIRVSSTKGVVTLTGVAPDQDAADRAAAVVKGVRGVVAVENKIQVGSIGGT